MGGSPATLDAIVVTGRKIQEAVPDAEVKQRVETAMRSDQYFYDEHVTITIKDGVVTLHGIVFDDWDLRTARRIAKRIPGVKRVINDLEMELGGE
ncbi:MAG TPA: BON domain-containing protein [Steroidobacteraceae bacterium]|nr:BON domain-containing protein [Steroidobacteraceae bacterium]